MAARSRPADPEKPVARTKHTALSPASRARATSRKRTKESRLRRALQDVGVAGARESQTEVSAEASDELVHLLDHIWSVDDLRAICRTAVAEGIYQASVDSGEIPPGDETGPSAGLSLEDAVGTDVLDQHLLRIERDLEHQRRLREESRLWQEDQQLAKPGRKWSIATLRVALAGEACVSPVAPHPPPM